MDGDVVLDNRREAVYRVTSLPCETRYIASLQQTGDAHLGVFNRFAHLYPSKTDHICIHCNL